MIFEDLMSFVKYLLDSELQIQDINMYVRSSSVSRQEPEKANDDFEYNIRMSESANILSFSDSPKINLKFGDKNILYVENLGFAPNSCGTARVDLLERSVYINACSDCADDDPHIKLDLQIGDKIFKNVDICLSESVEYKNTLFLNKETLNEQNKLDEAGSEGSTE